MVSSDHEEKPTNGLINKISSLKKPLTSAKDSFWHYYEQVSFITWHYFYFIAICLLASVIFWGSSSPGFKVRYIDSLFMTVSAMTSAGLNTVNISQLNTWQQVILFFLIILGSPVLLSCAVIHVRKAAFKRRLQELSDRRQQKKLSRSRTWIDGVRGKLSPKVPGNPFARPGLDGSRLDPVQETTTESGTNGSSNSLESTKFDETEDEQASQGHEDFATIKSPKSNSRVTFAPEVKLPRSMTMGTQSRLNNSLLSRRGVGAHTATSHPRTAMPLDETEFVDTGLMHHRHTLHLHKYLDTFNGYVGRNSQFHQLTEEERRKLGGIEYDALCVLSWVVPAYLVLFQLIGALGCGAWILLNRPDVATSNGVGPFWTGVFFGVSAFNNSGMALIDANMTVLQTSYYMLLTLSLLSLAGNTCFPIFLRLILWTMKHCSKQWTHRRCVLEYILDHPRRVYTNLFPSGATWWLTLVLFCIDGADWILFILLNLKNAAVTVIEPKFRVIDALFQAFAVRGSGFYIVSISALSPGTLMLYASMMYLSAYPITMSIRSTNVYEERSLGVFADDTPAPVKSTNPILAEPDPKPILNRAQTTFKLVRQMTTRAGNGVKSLSGFSKSADSPPEQQKSWNSGDFLRLQLRSQLGHDLGWLAAAIFFIVVIESSLVARDPVNFSVFNFIFEAVSAYGPVGLSVGVPGQAYSFSGEWRTLSKLILCMIMMRGRHRGLPVAIDRAILLPDESLNWAEEEDGLLKRSRTAFNIALSSRTTPATTPGVTPHIGFNTGIGINTGTGTSASTRNATTIRFATTPETQV